MSKKPEFGVLLFSLSALFWVLYTIYGTPQQLNTLLNIKPTKTEEDLRHKWGPAAWQTLHHMAAFYKENLREEDSVVIQNFLLNFADMLPCKQCGQHFRDIVRKNKPPSTNRLALVNYMCQIHNNVNQLRGKPNFNCDIKRLSEMYGGDCGCN